LIKIIEPGTSPCKCWLILHLQGEYATTFKFESGGSTNKLTGTSKPLGEYKFWVIRVWVISEKCLRLEPVKKRQGYF
jgi:hypothetical protein